MTFAEVLDQVRARLGTEIVVVLWLTEFGPGEGWLLDVDGRLERVDDPLPGVDQPVHYVASRAVTGFALERTWFKAAQWNVVAEQRHSTWTSVPSRCR